MRNLISYMLIHKSTWGRKPIAAVKALFAITLIAIGSAASANVATWASFEGAYHEHLVGNNLFTVGSDANGAAGFSNDNTQIAPFCLGGGGTITFDAHVPSLKDDGTANGSTADIRFVFQDVAWPETDAAKTVDGLTQTVSTSVAASYSLSIPAQNLVPAHSVFLMYLDTRDVEVIVSDVTVTHDTCPTVTASISLTAPSGAADVVVLVGDDYYDATQDASGLWTADFDVTMSSSFEYLWEVDFATEDLEAQNNAGECSDDGLAANSSRIFTAGIIDTSKTGDVYNLCTSAPAADNYSVTFSVPNRTFAWLDIGPDGPSDTTIVQDPDVASNMVAFSTREGAGAGIDPWNGTLFVATNGDGETEGFKFQSAVTDVDGNETSPADLLASMRVRSASVDTPVSLKFETADGGSGVLAKAFTSKADEWETLTFDFSAPAEGAVSFDATYAKVIIIFDQNSTNSNDQLFYFDDITYGGVTAGADTGPSVGLPVDFELPVSAYSVSGFGGGFANVEDAPDGGKAFKYVKYDGEVWAGVTLLLDTPVDISQGSVITARVNSSVARTFTMKLDAANVQVDAATSGSGWETLSFDFSALGVVDVQSSISFFQDIGTAGAGAGEDADWTVFIDDVIQVGVTNPVTPVGPTIALPVDFEEAADAYEIAGFDGGVASVEAGPDGAVSLKYVKGAGQNWAGVWINLDTAVDAANGAILTAAVHSTVARDITLKFDAANVERVASHTGSGWEALSYDFTGAVPADQTKIAFFNDLSQQGDGTDAWTIYIDNLAQASGGGDTGGGDTGGGDTGGGDTGATIALPVDFEEAADAYEIAGFDGGVASVEAGPDGAVSLKYVKGAGQNWAGVWINLDTAVDSANGEVMTADVYSTEARDITLKFDVANVERVASHTGSGWEALSYDFTGAVPADQTKIAFFNDLSQQGDGTDAWTIYIDNLAQSTGGDTGGTDPESTLTLTVTADATTVGITGPWWEWGTGGPAATDNGDGTWTVVFDPAPADTMEYKWLLDGVQEDLVTPAAAGECTAEIDAGTINTDYSAWGNRYWTVGSGNRSETAGACAGTSTDTGGGDTGGGDTGATIALPVDFEEAAADYEIAGFDGGVATVEAGPDGANSLKYVKGAGQNWAGVWINLDTAVDSANGEVMTADVYSTVARDITLKFDAANVERVASHTGSGWEALSYDFTGAMPADQTKIAFFNDLSQQGDGTEAWTIYIDNLAQESGGVVPEPGATIALPVDFEEAAADYEIAGFDGGVASVEAGPDGAVSLKYVKGAGQNWAGVWINLDTAVDSANGEIVTAAVHSTVARDITLKFDAANVERVASHTGSGWEALSYDFTGAMPADQTKIAFFNDLSQQGDGTDAWTIYIDNLAQTNVAPGPVDSDNDGVNDDEDAFPNDASETADSDSDGTGDNADAFPNDASETADSDSDGVGDNADFAPNDPAVQDGPKQSVSVSDSPKGMVDSTVSVTVGYDVSDNNASLTGLGLRVHYDSSVLTFVEFADVLSTDTIESGSVNNDTDNDDGDASTDKYVTASWASLFGNWPGTLPADLLTATFNVVNDDSVESTVINFSASSNAAGYQFDATPYTMDILSGSFDFDGNGSADALTDGLMLLRYAFGLSGTAVTDGAIASDSPMSSDEVLAALDTASNSFADIDGNGVVDALTDGLMLLRSLFGLTGDAVISGAVGNGATRTTAADIEAYIDSMSP